jgi:hypothetical protein
VSSDFLASSFVEHLMCAQNVIDELSDLVANSFGGAVHATQDAIVAPFD